jgi:hypothetical protein
MEITELPAQKPRALRQWEVAFTHVPIIAHHLSFVVPAAAFIQYKYSMPPTILKAFSHCLAGKRTPAFSLCPF